MVWGVCECCGRKFLRNGHDKDCVNCHECVRRIKAGEVRKPCLGCGELMVIRSWQKRYCERCLAEKHRERCRENSRRKAKGFNEKVRETKVVDWHGVCERCEHFWRCRALVRTTWPVMCQLEDVAWEGGKNPGMVLMDWRM